MRRSALLACLLAVASAALADDPKRKPLPISAHNCYPVDELGKNRLSEALALGIDNIEIDLGWDAEKKRLIVSHDPTPKGGTYRAFAAVVHSRGSYRDDPSSYAKEPASAYHRFLTFDWSAVEAGGPPLARDWSGEEAARLEAIVRSAHAKGYRV